MAGEPVQKIVSRQVTIGERKPMSGRTVAASGGFGRTGGSGVPSAVDVAFLSFEPLGGLHSHQLICM